MRICVGDWVEPSSGTELNPTNPKRWNVALVVDVTIHDDNLFFTIARNGSEIERVPADRLTLKHPGPRGDMRRAALFLWDWGMRSAGGGHRLFPGHMVKVKGNLGIVLSIHGELALVRHFATELQLAYETKHIELLPMVEQAQRKVRP